MFFFHVTYRAFKCVDRSVQTAAKFWRTTSVCVGLLLQNPSQKPLIPIKKDLKTMTYQIPLFYNSGTLSDFQVTLNSSGSNDS